MDDLKKEPLIRFPEFLENWESKKIKQILLPVSDKVLVKKNQEYREIGIRSHGKGLFHKEPVTGESLGNKRVFWVKENMFVLNIVFAWEHAIAKTTKKEIGMIASHRFPMYKPVDNLCDVDFILFKFLTKKGKSLLQLASPGGAGRNKTLGQNEFKNLSIILPSLPEQIKISKFLTFVDQKIEKLTKKKQLLESYKKGVMQLIFNQDIRFKDDNGNDYSDWESKELGEMLSYEQPTKYLVDSVEYNNTYKTPVLTAGKTFILGYTNEENGIFKEGLPVIIFDDFTTANKFVDFEFKAKSSAMKILKKVDDNINIKYVYEAMQLVNLSSGEEHKRYWISEYQHINIDVPCLEEQQKIADFLTEIDKKINLVEKQLEGTKKYKKGLLQQMFI